MQSKQSDTNEGVKMNDGNMKNNKMIVQNGMSDSEKVKMDIDKMFENLKRESQESTMLRTEGKYDTSSFDAETIPTGGVLKGGNVLEYNAPMRKRYRDEKYEFAQNNTDNEMEGMTENINELKKIIYGGSVENNMESKMGEDMNTEELRGNLKDMMANIEGGSIGLNMKHESDKLIDVASGGELSEINKLINSYQKGGKVDIHQIDDPSLDPQVNYSATSEDMMKLNDIIGGAGKEDEESEEENEFEESEEDDSSSSSSSSSSSNENEEDEDKDMESEDSINTDQIEVMGNAMKRQKNKMRFLEAKVSDSTTPRDYKINARPFYSTSGSELNSSFASEYLNNMRQKDRIH